ncbi:VanZ family protein [Corynebacterium resistens]|uniref:VanZ family protein n=1 Tax=Corynebacterium resistens TaxID=258224 RepID=UPI00235353DB|nr:VanZ family protein [Corynebacterium resistens]
MRRQGSPSRGLIAVALMGYGVVILALTTLRAFYQIGYLWAPENQRVRELVLVPLTMMIRSDSWFGPIFDYLGNIAFFIPFGMLLFVALCRQTYSRLKVVIVGFTVSLCIEVSQFVFSLGYTSLDDLFCNTLGAFIGAWFAKACGPRFHKVWVCLAIALTVVFAVLVGLGERLGNPDQVVHL